MADQKQKNIIESLQTLVEEQKKLTRGGGYDSARLEQLGRQTDVLVRKIAQTKILQQERFKGEREKLQQTYNELCLAIKAEQKHIKDGIEKVRKGKKTVSIYQKNL